MQWRTGHHCHRHQNAELREPVDGERTSDSVGLLQRVSGTGISLRQPKLRNDMSPARVAQTNWTFVETLLKVRPKCETGLAVAMFTLLQMATLGSSHLSLKYVAIP
jgi:hypothetical protein